MKSAAAAASAGSASSWAVVDDRGSLSEKRTVLCWPGVGLGPLRREFLAGAWRPEEGGLVGLMLDAWAKSSASEGSLGWDIVDAVAGVEKPWNCEVRSSSCFCKSGKESDREVALLCRKEGRFPESLACCVVVLSALEVTKHQDVTPASNAESYV